MIKDWLHANFDIVKTSSNNTEFVVCCPFCQNDAKFHMYVSAVKSAVICHKCGWSGNYYRLIMEVSGVESYAEAWRHVRHPNRLSDFQTVVERLHERKQQRLLVDMPKWYIPFNNDATLPYHAKIVLKYALKRLSWDDILRYRIGYCDHMQLPEALRMIIPIERGYYQARAVHGAAYVKYLNPDFPIEDRLFNYQALDSNEHVYVCEGAISAIAIGSNAVATLGANGATPEQRKRMVRSKVNKFALVVEPEKVAKEQAIKLADHLIGYGKQVRIRQYDVGDPADSVIFKEFDYNMAWKLGAI